MTSRTPGSEPGELPAHPSDRRVPPPGAFGAQGSGSHPGEPSAEPDGKDPPTGGTDAGARTEAPNAVRTDRRPWFADRFVWLAFLAAVVLDQVSKAAITATLIRGESWPAEGFFRFTYARNTGTVFGLFQGQGMLLTIASFAALAAMFFFFRGALFPSRFMRLAFGMMLGGAIGNLIDRIRVGSVVDFIDIGPWPIFNLADSMILVGIAILIWTATIRPSSVDGEQASEAGEASTPAMTAETEDDAPASPD